MLEAPRAEGAPVPARSPALALALLGAGGVAAVLAWALLSPVGAPAFLAEHFLRPVEAQAALREDATYTAPSLLGYGAVLALALGVLHWLLVERAGVKIDRAFFLVLAPFLLWGPLARALQDSGYLLDAAQAPLPLAYAVVEPVVYFTTAGLALAALLLAHATRAMPARARAWAPALAVGAIGAGAVLLFSSPALPYRLPSLALWGGVALALAFNEIARRRGDPGTAAGLALGLVLLGPLLTLAAAWSVAPFPLWPPPGSWGGNHPIAVPVAMGAAALAALAVVATARALARRIPALADAATPVAGALVFAHALDAASTLIAINDPLGWGLPAYGEQNPVSAALLVHAAGAPFLVAKILLAVGVAIVLARDARERGDARLGAFLALVVFALGWGPGARNLARLALGV